MKIKRDIERVIYREREIWRQRERERHTQTMTETDRARHTD